MPSYEANMHGTYTCIACEIRFRVNLSNVAHLVMPSSIENTTLPMYLNIDDNVVKERNVFFLLQSQNKIKSNNAYIFHAALYTTPAQIAIKRNIKEKFNCELRMSRNISLSSFVFICLFV